VQSLLGNHALVDGNERLGRLAVVAFYDNGVELNASDGAAYDFVISLADGTLSEVGAISAQLRQWSHST